MLNLCRSRFPLPSCGGGVNVFQMVEAEASLGEFDVHGMVDRDVMPLWIIHR